MDLQALPAAILAHLRANSPDAGIVRVDVQAAAEPVVVVHLERPGLLIGRQGATLRRIQGELARRWGPLQLRVVELRCPELEPLWLADTVLRQVTAGIDPLRALTRIGDKGLRARARALRLTVERADERWEQLLLAEGEQAAVLSAPEARSAASSRSAEDGAEWRCAVQLAPPL
ncbi:MAG: KH domain-containing protein [Nannocystis sp.]|nr:KH domain-containing protein [Nannocystis sp.]